MKLRQRLTEVRAARQRMVNARRQSAGCRARLHHQFDTHPLVWAGAAAGGGLLAGTATVPRRKILARLWRDPTLRWLLHLLIAATVGR